MRLSTPQIFYQLQDTNLTLDAEGTDYVLRIKDLPPEEKPREKLIKYGADALKVSELLAIVLGVGTKKEEVLHMAGRLLKEYGEKAIIHEKNPRKITEALSIPLTKSCQIIACLELGRRFYKRKGGQPEFIRTAKHVYEYLKDMRDLAKEHLRGLYLDTHYRLIHDEVISVGSLTANIIHPREVFKPALEHAASAVILAHNHPSGVAKASAADIEITRQLVEAGNILGIALLDHIIITKTSYATIKVDYR